MLGVSIDDVWDQPSLITDQGPTKKRSKYTRPVGQEFMTGGPRGFTGPGGHDGGHGVGGGAHGPSHNHANHPSLSARGVQAGPQNGGYQRSRVVTTEPSPQVQPSLPVQIPVGPSPQAREIPYLREQLTQQSSTVSDCQQQVQYLKGLVVQLKQELYAQKDRYEKQQRHKPGKKKKWMKCLYMILQLGLLLLIVILLIQVYQKTNRLLNAQVAF
jgi:hypothetical protein